MATRKDRATTLRLDGDLTVQEAVALRDRLRTALEGGAGVALDCRDAREVDVSFIQLLLSARLSAERRGASLSLAAPADGALLRAAGRCGFEPGGAEARFFGLEQGMKP